MLATKPDNLSSDPWNHMVERERLELSFDLHICAVAYVWFWFFETEFHCVVLAVLELTL